MTTINDDLRDFRRDVSLVARRGILRDIYQKAATGCVREMMERGQGNSGSDYRVFHKGKSVPIMNARDGHNDDGYSGEIRTRKTRETMK